MQKHLLKLTALALVAGCTVEAPRPPLKVDGSGLVIDEEKGTIRVNDTQIPAVSDCPDGSVLAKTEGKFSCVALSPADAIQLKGCTAGQVAGWDGTKWACLAGIDASSSPVVASCGTGKFIRRTATGWECSDAIDAAKTPVVTACANGQFVQMTAGGWACAMPLDPAVTPVVSACAPGERVAKSADGWSCSKIEAAEIDGFAAAAKSAVAGDIAAAKTNVEGQLATLASAKVDFARLENVPAGLADGDDVGLTQTAADGRYVLKTGGTVPTTSVTSATGTAEARLAALETALAALQTKVTTLEKADCPVGYTRDASVTEYTLCVTPPLERNSPVIVDGVGKRQEMVRVGDFWIDRYEATSSSDSDLNGGANGYNHRAMPISVAGSVPTAGRTWFQVQQMCANARKRLCTNAEWQMAASGTPDPAADGGDLGCNVNSNKGAGPNAGTSGTPANTGAHAGCVSRFGAMDMIGNMHEWVADWGQYGSVQTLFVGDAKFPWPAEYGGDASWGINGNALGPDATPPGMPGALSRGGAWNAGSPAGAFSIYAALGPAGVQSNLGFRCCTSR